MLKLIRVFLVVCYFVFVAIAGMFVCIFRPFNPDNTRLCGRMFSWGAIKLMGVRLQIEGREYLDAMRPGIVLANHQDNLDLFVHGAVIPKRTVSVGKKSLKYLPFFGQVYWLSGNIMIDRSKSRESINVMNQITDAIRQHDTSIWVFPEGTRNHGKELGPFKKGAFHMAVSAQSPIYPICASTYAKKLQLNKWHSGTVIVRILPPIETEGLTEADVPELLQSTRKRMLTQIEDMDNELWSDGVPSVQQA